jgi:DNA primase
VLLAGFIPEDKISEIKHAADIVDIVSEAVLLKKAGKNFIGLCPFHTEKTPSFTVSPDKQIFYCFGCGSGGNVFSFLMKQEGLSFPETARRLAKRYGIDLPIKPLSPNQKKKISEREGLFDINRRAMNFFHQTLCRKTAGQAARSYLGHRGISQKTIDDFKLGYAPDGWDRLLNYFSSQRVSPSLMEKSGLILPRKNKNGYYDRFRNRIMFPIMDANMLVIGFGGRVLDDSLPKYLNSPETPVYNKGRSLYGIQQAKEKCRATGTVFIVEGYLDLLALYQHGIENSVATLGTALTSDHVRLLTRYAGRMVLVYDSDEAGIRSAQRCIGTFWKEHVDFRRQDVFSEEKADTHILVLPAGHDPDSYVFEHGPEAFLKAASKSPGIITFLMNRAVDKHGLSTEGKIRIISELQQSLAAINDRVAQALYIKQLAERIGIAETAILERIRDIAADKSRRISPDLTTNAPLSGSKVRDEKESVSEFKGPESIFTGSRVERQIIAMMIQFPEILPDVNNYKILELFNDNVLKEIGKSILEFNPTSADQVSELMSQVDDRQTQALIASLAMGDESWNRKGCLRLLGRFVESGRKLRDGGLLEMQIKDAEKINDHALLLKLLAKKQKMAERSERQKMAILNEN